MEFKTKIVLKDGNIFLSQDELLCALEKIESSHNAGSIGVIFDNVCSWEEGEYANVLYGTFKVSDDKIGALISSKYVLIENISSLEYYNSDINNNGACAKPNFPNDRIN